MCEFRGFVASPVAGTPQGLAVYQNGVRINEAFGDTVNWDLIPTAAIRSVSVVTNNPAFGLNALGGAVNVQMKDGFNYHGAEIDTMGGSFGRIQGSAQWGKQVDNNLAVYGALEGAARQRLSQFFGIGHPPLLWRCRLQERRQRISPQYGRRRQQVRRRSHCAGRIAAAILGRDLHDAANHANKVGYLNLTGKVEATPTWTFEGIGASAGFRPEDPWTAIRPAPSRARRSDAACASTMTRTPANGLNGVQLANPSRPAPCSARSIAPRPVRPPAGFSLQATNNDQLFGHDNRFVVGASFDASVTRFAASAELGTIGTNYVVSGSGIFLGQSGDPVSIGPVVASHHQSIYRALCARHVRRHQCFLDHRRAGGSTSRRSRLRTRSAPRSTATRRFNRFNPIIGGTYKITPEVTAYAGYSEANRAPTPLELGCADPAHPCIIAAFLVSDPPLKQVVSHTVEAGLRGTHELNIGTLGWKIGGFRATNTDDILAIPSPALQGFGYFQNVGSTRRQGIEAEVNLQVERAYSSTPAMHSWMRASWISLLVGSNSPFADADGNVQISARQSNSGYPAQSDQGRLRLLDHRRIQGRRRRAIRQRPILCRR